MEKSILNQLLENRTLFHFYQLCQIPRGSGNEKQVSDYILKWACSLGLQAKQDEVYNLVIKKEASAGYEKAAPILLQAHLDMVCDKEPGAEHDFLKDAIPWEIKDDWIFSAKGTTLGADCGIGVALIMAILEDNDLKAPEIEVLLTVREETDMAGAYHVSQKDFHSKRIINLDISPDNRLLMGSCGGEAIEVEIPVERCIVEAKTLCLRVGGLKGGHSGSDIHRGRGNAILLLGRILDEICAEGIPVQLVRIHGGNSRLAIPREAEAEIIVPEKYWEQLGNSCKKINAIVRDTWQLNATDIDILLECNENTTVNSFTKISTEHIIKALMIMPDGIREMSDVLLGNVESSSNLGVIRTGINQVECIIEIRGNHEFTRKDVERKIMLVAENFGGSCKIHSSYPEWRYQKNSELRKLILEQYRNQYQQEMECVCVHAGNEVGILFEKLDVEDAVAMGPTRLFFHTPKEKLYVKSVEQFEVFLKNILEQLK